MIIESKGAQFFFACLGLALCAAGLYGFLDLDNVIFNFCRSTTGSVFFNTLNQILTIIVLLITSAIGCLCFWLVIHSVRECRKFRGEGVFLDWKKIFKTLLAYLIMLTVISTIVILLNQFVINKAVMNYGWNGQSLRTDVKAKAKERVRCVAEIISFDNKKAYESAPELSGVIGNASLRLVAPDYLKGKVLAIRVMHDDENKKLWMSVGKTIQFTDTKLIIDSGKPVYSNALHPFP